MEDAVQVLEKVEGQSLRRSSRMPKEVGILLVGCDAHGRDFIERTKTVVLSRHGAGIVSSHKLGVEQEMVLVQVENNKETEIRIVGQIGASGGWYTYGVAFLRPHVNFWGVEFPADSLAEPAGSGTTVECNRCGRCEVIAADTLESDIYALHDGILRDCRTCKTSTLWIKSSQKVVQSFELPLTGPESSRPTAASVRRPEPASARTKRKHPRINVKFTACVRAAGSEDTIVQCENVSRGGLCFKSSKRFYATSYIEVAAPYTPGSPCILVPARIVYVQELPEEKMYRCGVQYLSVTSDPRA
jgi:hypothetical protein